MKTKATVLKGTLIVISLMLLFFFSLILVQLVTGSGLEWTFSFGLFILALLLTLFGCFGVLFFLYQVVDLIAKNNAFSNRTLQLVARVKYMILTTAIVFLGILPYIYDTAQENGAPGMLFFSIVLVSVPFIAFVFSLIVEELFKSAIVLKTEHDLTV